MKKAMQFVGVMYALLFSLILFATFLGAYTTETKEITVTINTKGEPVNERIVAPIPTQSTVIVLFSEENILQSFLTDDTTNERIYTDYPPYFTCGHFTEQLIKNATKKGIKMYPTFLFSKRGVNHIIAAAKINGTWIFIEPMSDKTFKEGELRRNYKGYKIGESISCCSYSRLNWVDGFIKIEMWR